jgi:hypothetical protein
MPATRALRPELVVDPDSLDRALLEAATTGPARHVPVLGRRGELPEDQRRDALRAEASAQAVADVTAVDAEQVASWIVERYQVQPHPAMLLGSPHGAAIHLAAALGVPWLPTGFTVRVPWPGGSAGDWAGAAEEGHAVANRILAANPGVSVRQVHDPVQDGSLCGATLTMHLRWQRLPAAYDRFLRSTLTPGGITLLLRDLRTWPVMQLSRGHSMQVGSPVSGWSYASYDADRPAFRDLLDDVGVENWLRPPPDLAPQYAERGGDPALGPDLRRLAADLGGQARRVLYASPDILSACVADLYREHLRATVGSAESCLIETGRMLDPWQVLGRGLVPYWCESAARRTVGAAEWWLAGSSPYDQVTAVPEPPGTVCDAHAGLRLWRSVAGFGRRHGEVDQQAARRYPRLPLPRGHLSGVIRALCGPILAVPPMTADQVMTGLRTHGARPGLLVG